MVLVPGVAIFLAGSLFWFTAGSGGRDLWGAVMGASLILSMMGIALTISGMALCMMIMFPQHFEAKLKLSWRLCTVCLTCPNGPLNARSQGW